MTQHIYLYDLQSWNSYFYFLFRNMNVRLERYNPLSSNFKINTFLAGLSCLLFSLTYVGLLYVSKKTRISNENPRLTKDHPMVVKQRIKVTLITCIICCVSVLSIINFSNGFKNDQGEEMVCNIFIFFFFFTC